MDQQNTNDKVVFQDLLPIIPAKYHVHIELNGLCLLTCEAPIARILIAAKRWMIRKHTQILRTNSTVQHRINNVKPRQKRNMTFPGWQVFQ